MGRRTAALVKQRDGWRCDWRVIGYVLRHTLPYGTGILPRNAEDILGPQCVSYIDRKVKAPHRAQ